jgi:uncharacterized protein YidB (DUF937 family)
MSLFDLIKNQLGEVMAAESAGAAGAQAPAHDPHAMLGSVIDLISQHGGLGGLVGKLQAGGLADAVASWVGTGANQDVSPTEIGSAVGSDVVSQIAGKLGLPPQQTKVLLAKYLPLVINHLTPNGKVEEGSVLDKALDLIRSQIAGGAKAGN